LSEEEYSLKGSTKLVGQLYPVLLDKHGRVIDGLHRLEDEPNWRTEKLEHIDTEEKFLIARLVANKFRRQVSSEEVREMINKLAEIYYKQGVKPGKISRVIAENTGYAPDTVREYLDSKYKREDLATAKAGLKPALEEPPVIKEAKKVLGEEKVEQLKKEIIKTEAPKIEKKVKKKLEKDWDFITEAISKAPEPPKQVVDELGRHIPTLRKEEAEKAVEAMKKAEEELERKKASPEAKERSVLTKNWMAHNDVIALSESLKCPVCGAGAENLVWKCHDINIFQARDLLKQKLEG